MRFGWGTFSIAPAATSSRHTLVTLFRIVSLALTSVGTVQPIAVASSGQSANHSAGGIPRSGLGSSSVRRHIQISAL